MAVNIPVSDNPDWLEEHFMIAYNEGQIEYCNGIMTALRNTGQEHLYNKLILKMTQAKN